MNDMLIFATTMNAAWNARNRVRTEDEFYEEFGHPTVFQRVSEWLRSLAGREPCATEQPSDGFGQCRYGPFAKAEQKTSRHCLPEGQTVFFVSR